MKKSIYLTTSLIITSLIIGTAFGYYLTPNYKQTMYQKESMGLGSPDRFLDLRYLNQMSTHHQGAIILANQIATTSTRPEIVTLASAIQSGEPKLIKSLSDLKITLYNDFKPAPQPIVPNLGPQDDKSDLRFLNALINHHEQGIQMTREAKAKSTTVEILNDADGVETFLIKSLVTLKQWRQDWYGI